MTRQSIAPGATLGILGSGQLGRMFAIAARQMGYRVATYSPDSDSPTGQVADHEWVGAYHDLANVRTFAKSVAAVTFEFENVPAATVEAITEIVPVRPDGRALHIAQNRIREKTWLREHGLPTAEFVALAPEGDLGAAVAQLGLPAILKTAGWGYDGKGQWRIDDIAQLPTIAAELRNREAILEQLIPFAHELSVIGVCGIDGEFVHYGALENIHRDHILDITLSPGRFPEAVTANAVKLTHQLMDALEYVGVLCVEFFLTDDHRLLINEIAPRPHNSGHLTIDACRTSQFAQQVRALTGMPPGSTAQPRPAAMANLLGDVWSQGAPDWAAALSDPLVSLHLYGKTEARAKRKMGHLVALGDSVEGALEQVLTARDGLTLPHPLPGKLREGDPKT